MSTSSPAVMVISLVENPLEVQSTSTVFAWHRQVTKTNKLAIKKKQQPPVPVLKFTVKQYNQSSIKASIQLARMVWANRALKMQKPADCRYKTLRTDICRKLI